MPTKDDLKLLQALPLEIKIGKTKNRIREWVNAYGTDGVFVSFSGGKDSTVLLHIVRELYSNVEAVFVNTGLEYPEIQQFVKTFDNVTILRPKMRFDEVVKECGYPIIGKRQAGTARLARNNIRDGKYSHRLMRIGITTKEATEMGLELPPREMLDRYEASLIGSKFQMERYRELLDMDFKISDQCCDVMKKRPVHEFEKRTGKAPILATMTSESMLRETAWLQNGCNAFDAKRPRSTPMSFWTEQDVLQYIKRFNVPIASVYGTVEYSTDQDQMRFEDFGIYNCGTETLCTTGCSRTGCIFCAFGAHLEKGEGRFERLKRTHPKQYAYCIGGGEYVDGMWQPNKQGLGMGHVFDELNKIYGEGFIRY